MACAIRTAFAALLVFALSVGVAGASQLGAPPPPPPPPPPPAMSGPPLPEGTAAISGVVIDAATGRPVPGASVTITPRARASSATGATTPNPALRMRGIRQLTDSKGRFVFRDLPGFDAFVLSATRFGYFDGNYGTASGQEKRIVLADGQWFPDARIEIWKAGAIGGTVVDERGEPVVRAWVRVVAQMPIAGRQVLASGPAVRTDDRGVYRISGLQPGRYIVSVPQVQHAVPATTPGATLEALTAQAAATAEASGRVPGSNVTALDVDATSRLIVGSYLAPPPASSAQRQTYPSVYFPNALSIAEAMPVDLARGRDRDNVDFQLRPVSAWTVRGIVDGSAGVAAGLSLRLVTRGTEDLGRGSETATALVAADGRFAFLNVPTGSYTIEARRGVSEYTYASPGSVTGPFPVAPGLTLTSSGGGTLYPGPAGAQFSYTNSAGDATTWGRMAVEVGAADVDNVVVPMRVGVSITGRIVREADPGAPPAPTAQGLVAIVLVEPAAGMPSLGMPSARLEGKEFPQTFRIEGLMPGRYFIRVLGGGGAVKSIIANDRNLTFTGFDTTAGQNIDDAVVTLTSQRAQLNGVVTTTAGPVSEAAVIAFPVEREQWSLYGLQPVRLRSVSVSSSGSYEFTGLPAGEYHLIAVDAAYGDGWKDPQFLQTVAPLASRVTLTWGQTTTQALRLSQVKR